MLWEAQTDKRLSQTAVYKLILRVVCTTYNATAWYIFLKKKEVNMVKKKSCPESVGEIRPQTALPDIAVRYSTILSHRDLIAWQTHF